MHEVDYAVDRQVRWGRVENFSFWRCQLDSFPIDDACKPWCFIIKNAFNIQSMYKTDEIWAEWGDWINWCARENSSAGRKLWHENGIEGKLTWRHISNRNRQYQAIPPCIEIILMKLHFGVGYLDSTVILHVKQQKYVSSIHQQTLPFCPANQRPGIFDDSARKILRH